MARRIYKTKNGQPYIKLANGRARFIKKTSARGIRIVRGKPKTFKQKRKSLKRPMPKINTMARRKSKARRVYRYAKSKLTMKNMALGAAAFAVAEPYLDSYVITAIQRFVPVPTGAIKTGIGYYGMKKTKGLIKGIMASMFILGVNDLVKGFNIGMPVVSSVSSTNGGGW